MSEFYQTLKDKFSQYEFLDDALEWLTKNTQKLVDLFSNYALRDYIKHYNHVPMGVGRFVGSSLTN
jgi:hypothetical protein